MVAASQDAPRAAWWMDQHRLLVRRIDRLNFVHQELSEGLPDGVIVRRESTKTANDMLVIYVDGVSVERISNIDGDGAAPVAQWIERYAEEMNVADVTEQGLALLKELAKAGGVKGIAYTNAHGATINALAKKGLVVKDRNYVTITEAGIDVLRGLPEFDMPVIQGQTSPPAEEPTSPPAPLQEERGEGRDAVLYVAADPVDAALDEVRRQYFDELREQLVRVVMADGIGLDAVVEACGAEIMAMGGTVIKLELKEALLRELYPPLSKLLDGLDAVGASYSVIGDLQIIVERPLKDANDEIDLLPQ